MYKIVTLSAVNNIIITSIGRYYGGNMDKYTLFAVTLLAISIIILAYTYLNIHAGTSKTKIFAFTNKIDDSSFFNTIGSLIDRFYVPVLLLIFAVFLVSRILRLEEFPHGFHVDELSMAIDAKCLRYWGTDRSGIHMPPYFFNYGGGQNALSTYVNALLYFFLPTTLFTMRIMAVVWGALTFFAMFGIFYEITENKKYSLLGPILVTVSPVYIMSERWGLESYVLLPFCTFTFYFMIRAFKYHKIHDFILTGVFMGLSMYTYAVAYIMWPIFLVFTGGYVIYLKQVNVKETFAFGIPLAIVTMPVLIYQFVNEGIIPPFSLGFSDFYPLPIAREGDMGFQYIFENLLFVKELFLGGEELTYNSYKEFGTIYMFMLPLVLIGFVMCIADLVKSIKTKTYNPIALFIFQLIGGVAFTLILRGPNVNRANELFLPFMLFIFIAIYRLMDGKSIGMCIYGLCTAASFLFFMYFYFKGAVGVYGFHPMYTSASPYFAVNYAMENYAYDENTRVYLSYDDIDIAPGIQAYYFWGKPDEKWTEEGREYGNVYLGLPEDFDENENAIYVLDNANRSHVTSALVGIGFLCDQQFDGYSIVYKGHLD